MPPKSHLLILSKCYFGGIIIFSPRKEHFIKLRRCWLGTKIAFAKDCTYVHMIRHSKAYQLTYHDWHCMQDEAYWIPTFIFFRIQNFGIGIPISWFFNSGIWKKNPTGIFGIKNGIGILLMMGVPEIGTKNRNSHPSNVSLAAMHQCMRGEGFEFITKTPATILHPVAFGCHRTHGNKKHLHTCILVRDLPAITVSTSAYTCVSGSVSLG